MKLRSNKMCEPLQGKKKNPIDEFNLKGEVKK